MKTKITTRLHSHRPIHELSIMNLVTEGKPFTFICYADSDKPAWWTPFLKKGFSHCFLIHWDGQQWLRLEKCYGCFEVTPLLWLDRVFVGRFNLQPYFEYVGYTVQVVNLERREPEQMRVKQLFAPNTCVEFIKDFLGIKASFVNTPYQLFKHLEE